MTPLAYAVIILFVFAIFHLLFSSDDDDDDFFPNSNAVT